MSKTKTLLFNFSASHTGGGLKRLYEFSKWFNEKGGTNIIIHPNCKNLIETFSNNNFFVVKQNIFDRFFNDCFYLNEIMSEIGDIDFYYSYGIPIYKKIASKHWFHLSNISPFIPYSIELDLLVRLKMIVLGHRIKNNLNNCDHISAESDFSLSHMPKKYHSRLFLSVNGSDDEINYLTKNNEGEIKDIAVTVGTHKYKKTNNVYKMYLELLKNNPELKLVIIGDPINLEQHIIDNTNIKKTGIISREQVIELLMRSKYFLTATTTENSYNAAAEGIYLAEESYISDIQPHYELVNGMDYKVIQNNAGSFIHIRKKDLSLTNIRSWNDVVIQILNEAEISL